MTTQRDDGPHPSMTIGRALLSIVVICACEPPPTQEAVSFQGVVELEEQLLAFEIPGRVLGVAVDEGQWVEPGHDLARLDDTLERLNREARAAEARAAMADVDLLLAGARKEDIESLRQGLGGARSREHLARNEVERQRTLASQGIVTAAELDAAHSALEQATARRRELQSQLAGLKSGARREEIEAAQARAEAAETAVRAADERIARHVLHAETRGMVLAVHLDPYEFAATGTPVLTIGDVRRPYVDVFIPQGRIDGVKLGHAASITVDAASKPWAGSVEYIANRTEFTPKFLFSDRERPNLVIRVRIRIEDPDAKLHAGVPAFVAIEE